MQRLFLRVGCLLGLCVAEVPALTQKVQHLQSASGVAVTYEEFGDAASPDCLVLLHGASGPAVLTYRDQARFFASHGYRVLMPHYFDATHSTAPKPQNYAAWAALVTDFAAECRREPATRKVFVIGYSLGASVALAAGSQLPPVDAIAEWYGSLPDDFFYRFKGMPPLLILHGEQDTNIPLGNAEQLIKLCGLQHLRCEHHVYPGQGHGFTGEALGDAEERTLAFLARN